MIEIKAWDLTNKKWWTDVLSEMGECEMYDDDLSMKEAGKMMEEGDDSVFKFCRYTGLKDKNGIKIFEGDILLAKGFWDIYIVWDNKNARFGFLNTDWVVSQGKIKSLPVFELKNIYEVTGNIYENPELIENNIQ